MNMAIAAAVMAFLLIGGPVVALWNPDGTVGYVVGIVMLLASVPLSVLLAWYLA